MNPDNWMNAISDGKKDWDFDDIRLYIEKINGWV